LRIKICGITQESDGEQAALLGADAVGLNFHPPSPRYVHPLNAAFILRALPPFVDAVGLFVNQSLRDIFPALNSLGRIRTIQWHGDQREISDTYPYQLIPAFAVRDAGSLREIQHYLEACRAVDKLPAAILVDAHVPGQYGGTGQQAPWHLLADFQPGLPLILAGGLTPDNIAEAVRIVRPYAVDVASGVEQSPGRKDVEKMRRFIGNAREAAAR
jgi:phosphoribosylanthranilate isomerase